MKKILLGFLLSCILAVLFLTWRRIDELMVGFDQVDTIYIVTYDLINETTSDAWLYEGDDLDTLTRDLRWLRGKQVEKLPLDKGVTELYSIEANAFNGVRFLVYDDYLITSSGKYYKVNGKALKRKVRQVIGDSYGFRDFYHITNHRHLSLIDGAWVTDLMYKSPFSGIAFDNVVVKIENEQIDKESKSVIYKIGNHDDSTIEFGARVYLEALVDGVWYAIDDMTKNGESLGWIDILYSLEPNASDDYMFSLKNYQPLPEGNYRLVKEVWHGNRSAEGYIALEFEIE